MPVSAEGEADGVVEGNGEDEDDGEEKAVAASEDEEDVEMVDKNVDG